MSLHWYKASKRGKHIKDGGYFYNPKDEYVLGFGDDDTKADTVSAKDVLVKALEGKDRTFTEMREVELTRDEVLEKFADFLEAHNVQVSEEDKTTAKSELNAKDL